MTSMVSTAVSAVIAALNAAPAVAGQVARVRLRPWAADVMQAVVVRPVESQADQTAITTGLPVSWTTAIAVDCYARSKAAATAPDAAVDALLESVYARLMTDASLGGAVLALIPQGISYEFDVDGEQTTCAVLTFQARHRTGGASL